MDRDLGDFPGQAARWVADLDASALRRARRSQLEKIADGVVAVSGILLLDWSPYPMLLFLIASLWLGLLETLAEWLLDRERLARIVSERREVEEARTILRRERDGQPTHEPRRPLPTGFGAQLAIAIGLSAAFTISLLVQLRGEAGIAVGQLLIDRPDMLLMMGGLLALRLQGLVRRVRRPHDRAPWLRTVTPVLDMILFVMLIFFWTVIAGIALKIEEIVGGDRQYIAAVVFVCAGYGLMAWRAVHELRDLRQLPLDLAWLAARDER